MKATVGWAVAAAMALAAMPDVSAASDAMRQWHDHFVATLDHGSAQDVVALSLFEQWHRQGNQSERVVRAVKAAPTDPLVQWYGAVTANCSLQAVGPRCPEALDAARALTHADGSNAFAWLTLAWVAYEAGDPQAQRDALEHAEKAPRIHDYVFDLTKAAVSALQRVPLPASDRGDFASVNDDQATLMQSAIAGSIGDEVVAYGAQGCLSGAAKPTCPTVQALFQRGDSWRSLRGAPDKQKAMQAGMLVALEQAPTDPAAAHRALEALKESKSEAEWSERMKAAK